MIDFAYRNLNLFIKDRVALLLSFLAEGIVAGLYVLFIRKKMLDTFCRIPNADLLMDTWMIAGILGITSLTVSMGMYGIMVEDKNKRIKRDFIISPVSRFSVILGYFFGAAAAGLFMTILAFFLSSFYFLSVYQVRLGVEAGIKLFGVFVLLTFSNAAMVLFVVSFIKSSNALACLCTILGALVGFLTGIYIPVGNMPDAVKKMVICFPASHAVVLLRQILMEPFIQKSFQNKNSAYAVSFRKYMGVEYVWDTWTFRTSDSVFILLFTFVCFLFLAMLSDGRGE